MAVVFELTQPDQLLAAFIRELARGTITSWRIDHRGYVTHTSSQWTRQAWFVPTVSAGRLTLHILSDTSKPVSRSAFVFYQTHLLETFMRHFFMLYERASVTANASTLELAA
jgi:hypothetical protein